MNFLSRIMLVALGLLIPFSVSAQEEKGGAQSSASQGASLLGKPLVPMDLSPLREQKLLDDLNSAKSALSEIDSQQLEQRVWVGRRYGYLQQYGKAIEQFSACIEQSPEWPHAYRHRGHRYISLRKFDLAIADLSKAGKLIAGTKDEVEQDGAPNQAGVPTSTLHTNVWYHLGLAHYLKGDFVSALKAYRLCLAASKNDDMKVATLDWMYMTLRRLGRNDEAKALLDQVSNEMQILENHAYHRRLLMYRGELKLEDLIPKSGSDQYDLDLATYGYGIGNWYLCNGETEKAIATFEKVVAGKYWSAFGYVAAEAELSRIQSRK